MADHDAPEFVDCAVCGRTILRGERVFEHVTAEGQRRLVCSLCRSRAEATGWMPAHLADEPMPPAAAPAAPAKRVPEREPPVEADPEPPAAEREPMPVIRDDRSLGERALDAFNASEERRKIAGLRRSLGEPSVAVEEGEDTATVTVAWELSWYRWRVEPEGGAGVIELAKGSEMEEIDPQPDWNARADEDGRVSLTGP